MKKSWTASNSQWALQRGRGAFTLIEVLVAMGILAILAGLLFPVFATSRNSARGTVCASNLQNIGKAVQIYLADVDDRYPPVCEPYLVPFYLQIGGRDADHARASIALDKAIRGYMTANAVYRCPRDSGTKVADFLGFPSVQQPSSFESTGSSYWFNEVLYFLDATSTSVMFPSEAALVNDRCGAWHGSIDASGVRRNSSPVAVDPGYRYTTQFTDGHVRMLTPRQLNAAKGAVYGKGWILDVEWP